MKKIMMLMLAMCLLGSNANAQNKELEKQRKKEYKTKIKKYKEGGWELFASSRSLEVALLTHYEKLNKSDDVTEIVATASNFKSKNIGHQMAINNACIQYAQSAGSHVRGAISSEMQGDAVNENQEIDYFYAAYTRNVEKEIKGEMKESFSVIRSTGNGIFEMETYFLVDEESASKARIRAMENAAKESKIAQERASRIANFVKERFETE